jgi:hypothetical protein
VSARRQREGGADKLAAQRGDGTLAPLASPHLGVNGLRASHRGPVKGAVALLAFALFSCVSLSALLSLSQAEVAAALGAMGRPVRKSNCKRDRAGDDK